LEKPGDPFLEMTGDMSNFRGHIRKVHLPSHKEKSQDAKPPNLKREASQAIGTSGSPPLHELQETREKKKKLLEGSHVKERIRGGGEVKNSSKKKPSEKNMNHIRWGIL